MNSGSKSVESFVGKKGRISNGRGTETDVTFSLYCSQAYDHGKPGDVLSDGFCRISNESDILNEFFKDGTTMFLSSAEVEAKIQLTSPCTFLVIGSILKK